MTFNRSLILSRRNNQFVKYLSKGFASICRKRCSCWLCWSRYLWLYYLWRCCCYMKVGKIVLILSLLDKHLSNPIIIRNHSLALKSQPRKGKSAILGPSLLFLNTLLYLKETTKCFGCDGHLHFYDSLDSVVISQIKRYQLFSWLLQYYQSVLNKDKRKDRNVAKIFMTKSLHVGTSYWQ